MNTVLSLENISHKYEQTDILKDISFKVNQENFFIVIGPNGSGKTTLLKTIAGIEKKYKGQIFISGRSLKEYSIGELARTMAYVPQTPPMDFPFSVFEVVRLGRSPHLGLLGSESKKDIEIAQKAMAFTDIEHLAKRKIHQLSGGECQRVNIARAICQEPKIILLDEPTASLDLGHQTQIMDLMEKLKTEQGMTIVMISHDVNLASVYGDHILILKDGKIVDQGPPIEVMTYQTIEFAYQCVVLLDKSPLGNHPRVTLVPEKYQQAPKQES
ncbi:iron-dicitrate ABC transporter ATP-binding protein [Candidatus Magnetomorum sp. HK-1]|nr:iron-dicitrate ABC transporter ATP-binding protein [Candidatus Magnetomorum sp. HK-1]